MIQEFIDSALPYLACPYCHGQLTDRDKSLYCSLCDVDYDYDDKGRLIILLPREKPVSIEFKLTADCYRERIFPRMPKSMSGVFSHEPGLPRMGERYYNSMPVAERRDSVCLDIGCGAMTKRPFIEKLGYKYLGFDCDDPGAPIVGDAHAIPFFSNSFDLATADVVMEHFRQPWIVIREVFRILKPGGYYQGRVAFMECFHDSYFHMTHWATSSLLENAGFEIVWLEPDVNNLWHVLHTMFPRIPGSLIRGAISPILLLYKIYWVLGMSLFNVSEKTRDNLEWRLPGGILFLAKKPR
jgi:SAM-dependent methyltransferase